MPVNKFSPLYMSTSGSDRRACTLRLNNATSSSITVSGYSSDIADFLNLFIYNADDLYGWLYGNKYFPDYDFTNLNLSFNITTTNCMNPYSQKFPSVRWESLSYMLIDGTTGVYPLNAVPSVGSGTAASITYTVNGTTPIYSRVQLVYNSNTIYDYECTAGDSRSNVALQLTNQINASTLTTNLVAVNSGSNFTVTYNRVGTDGNTVALLSIHDSTATCTLSPSGTNALTGGVDPVVNINIDFNSLFGSNVTKIRQLWITVAPILPIQNATNTLRAYTQQNMSWVMNSIALTGTGQQNIFFPGFGSVVVDSRDVAVYFSGTWITNEGFYHQGFASNTVTNGSKIFINYNCNFTHNIYLGTNLVSDGGQFNISLDGVSLSSISLYCSAGSYNY